MSPLSDDQLSADDLPRGMVLGQLGGRTTWAPGLATFCVDAACSFQEPGQFLTLGLLLPAGGLVRRAYSVASAPGHPLEFFIVEVPGGQLTPHLFAAAEGDQVVLGQKAAGNFTLSRVPDARDLWLLSTGTGLAPYISMLRHGTWRDRFEHVVVVHGVRQAADLAYRDELASLGPRVTYVPSATREAPGTVLAATATDAERPLSVGRLPALLAQGVLESIAGRTMSVAHSQIMLCGHPGMIQDISTLLDSRGLRRNRKREPGHVTMEKFWSG